MQPPWRRSVRRGVNGVPARRLRRRVPAPRTALRCPRAAFLQESRIRDSSTAVDAATVRAARWLDQRFYPVEPAPAARHWCRRKPRETITRRRWSAPRALSATRRAGNAGIERAQRSDPRTNARAQTHAARLRLRSHRRRARRLPERPLNAVTAASLRRIRVRSQAPPRHRTCASRCHARRSCRHLARHAASSSAARIARSVPSPSSRIARGPRLDAKPPPSTSPSTLHRVPPPQRQFRGLIPHIRRTGCRCARRRTAA